MKVISGTLKGRRINALPGLKIRPTKGRIKEAIFNILSHSIEKKYVLDLFAGTGALGIEALSRGATYGVFVDMDQNATAILAKNIEQLNLTKRARIIQENVIESQLLQQQFNAHFNLVFMDPPYKKNLIPKTLKKIHHDQVLLDDALIIVEHDKSDPVSEVLDHFMPIDNRKYGKTIITFFKYLNR